MRVNLTLLILILFGTTSYSQFFEKNRLFIKPAIAVGNYIGGSVALVFIQNSKISYSIMSYGLYRPANNRPADFTGGIASAITFGLGEATESATSGFLSVGRSWIKANGWLRLNLTGGIGVSEYSYPRDYTKLSASFLRANYTYVYDRDLSMAIIINPSMDFLVSRAYGLSIGLTSILSSDYAYVGVEMSYLLLGIVSPKRINKEKRSNNL